MGAANMKASGMILAVALLCALAPAAEAAFPGKPGRIAYSAQLPGEDQSAGQMVDRGYDIFTVNPDGTDRRRITLNGPEPDDDQDPAWSPNGSLLAFASFMPFTPMVPYPARGDSDLFLLAPDGSSKQMIPNTDEGFAPEFLPSGQRLYYSFVAIDLLGGATFSINLDGSGRQQEPPSTLQNYGAHISPDGRRKVFTMSGDVYASNLDGSGLEQLTNTSGVNESGPVFSPDASAIAFARSSPMLPVVNGTIVTLDLRTRAQTTVSAPSVPSFGPDWGAIPAKCRDTTATQVGTAAADALTGTGTDVITGLAGNDSILGEGDKDLLCGDEGDDKLDGGAGKDRLEGESGRDTLVGGDARDELVGGAGRDRLVGGKGRDILKGGKGKRDICIGGKGRDRAIGCEKTKGI